VESGGGTSSPAQDTILPYMLAGTARAAVSTWAAAVSTRATVAGTGAAIARGRPAIVPAVALRRGWRGVGQRRHTGGINHHVPEWPGAGALAAEFLLVAQGDVENAALAAVHRIEPEWRTRVLHLFRSGAGADPQFLNPQRPLIVGIE